MNIAKRPPPIGADANGPVGNVSGRHAYFSLENVLQSMLLGLTFKFIRA
jgi:hypothetical protein